jgi:hypothetical protein
MKVMNCTLLTVKNMRRPIFQIITAVIFMCSFGTNLIDATTPISRLTSSEKCRTPGTAREAMQEATAVFIGEVTKISESDNTKTLEFSIEQYWKGENTKTQNVQVSVGTRYSPSFNVGERYIVYASENGSGRLTTGRCTRTKLAQYADDDIKELGKGKKP